MVFHCEKCGNRYALDDYTPEKVQCKSCNHTRWKNPTPIAVCVIPMWSEESVSAQVGVLLGKRNKKGDPGHGEWGLPGGFVAPYGETNEHAMAREVYEELGLELDPNFIKLTHSYAPDDAAQLLTFGVYAKRPFFIEQVNKAFTPNEEVSEISVAWVPQPLAFQSHTEALERFLERANV